MTFEELIEGVKRAREGAKEAFSHGREDYREALKRAYIEEGRETDGSRINQMLGSNRTITMARELMGVQGPNPGILSQMFQAKPEHVRARQQMGLGLSSDGFTRAGQALGTLASDIVQDRGRELWWLLNAPQAAANVAQEMLLHKFAPDLYAADRQEINGKPIFGKALAKTQGLIDADGKPTAGVSIAYEDIGNKDEKGRPKKDKVYYKRRHPAGFVEALAIPTGFAVNQGIGLINPFGGQEGYKAVLEDPNDPSKTSNVVGEVAAKYILGKTGNLLPWDEFKKVRPDVSKDEYMRYKAFKFDNDGDMNPFDDGQMILPTGILKATTDGIHGAEVQFLGRSLPVNTALLPAAAAMAGTTLGARGIGRGRFKFKGGTAQGLAGGMTGALTGMAAGNLLEQERRRRNQAENERDKMERLGE